MNTLDPVIKALHHAIEMEKALQDFYRHAAHHAHDQHLASRFHGMEESHLTFVGHLETRREALQQQAGEGVLAHAIEAIGDAIHDLIAGLPVEFIRAETKPSIAMLIRREEQLIELYRNLGEKVDPETARLAAAAAENSEGNIAELRSIGML
jgi:rubrerythrin